MLAYYRGFDYTHNDLTENIQYSVKIGSKSIRGHFISGGQNVFSIHSPDNPKHQNNPMSFFTRNFFHFGRAENAWYVILKN